MPRGTIDDDDYRGIKLLRDYISLEKFLRILSLEGFLLEARKFCQFTDKLIAGKWKQVCERYIETRIF